MNLVQHRLGSGDSYYFENVIQHSTLNEKQFFNTLKDETKWYEMKHKDGVVPRLVSIQGEICCDSEGISKSVEKIPLYRHPVDNHPPFHKFSPLVLFIKVRQSF